MYLQKRFLWIYLLSLSSVLWAQSPDNTDKKYLNRPLPPAWADTAYEQTLPADDQWWKSFDDPLLDSLITVAVKQNYSVLTAMDRMEMARADLNIQRGDYYPTLGLDAGWTKQQTSGNVSELPRSRQQYFNTTLSSSWEIDVFGSIRMRVKAQKESFAASREEYNATMVSLCAQVASAYINLRELQQELDVLRKNGVSQEAVVHITEVRYNTGLVSKLDVAQAKSVYYSTLAAIPAIESGIQQNIHALAVLLGLYPQQIYPVLQPEGRLPEYMEPIGTGIPADLLRRRPDIRGAERQVNAQAALVGASRADWFPKFTLSGSVGYAARDLKNLVKSNSLTYEIAPTISINLFQGTKLINATALAKAQLNESVNQFNQTVLTAVQEVENAMSAYRNSIKQIVELRKVIYQGQETLTLSLDLYKQGLSPFQNVLDAQRSLLSYENSLVEAKGQSLLYLIQMYQALGGGF